MVSSVNNNQNSYSGIKTGMAVTALGGASIYSLGKVVDAATSLVAKESRRQFAAQTQNINELKNSFDVLTKYNSPNKALKDDILKLTEEAKEFRKGIYDNAFNTFKQRKIFKQINLKKSLAIAVPFYIGAGAIVDLANNKQRAKSEPNAETKNGNPYVKVNMGKKLGLGLGLACEGAMLALNKSVRNLATPGQKASGLITAAIGGFILGAIADKYSNKHAAKIADKNA